MIKMNDLVGKTISHYTILEKLGEGGMGEAYLAEDAKLERKGALKFLPAHYTSDPQVNARFQREAKAAAALSHPNLITVYKIGEHKGRAYIAMEYIDGKSLREIIVGAKNASPLQSV
jgi:serine/threonine protein kinase